eukprot:TRINITY_DN23400_c0_g1_i1.p1 TRINITY_DN23400_c0_g1~~TRINITY_DN23400_c0_g1_i1.p1  ORF type:complete len:707 (-),score=135.17 TRINITY_DN23400_c0_g1_i1:99-2219(-)
MAKTVTVVDDELRLVHAPLQMSRASIAAADFEPAIRTAARHEPIGQEAIADVVNAGVADEIAVADAGARAVSTASSCVEAEVASLRRGLAVVAEAVRAIRPAIDAEAGMRVEADRRLAERLDWSLQDLRVEIARLKPQSLSDSRGPKANITELAPFKALRAEVADLAPLKALRAEVAELAPLKSLRSELAELAPLKSLREEVAELAPLKALQGEVAELASLKSLRAEVAELASLKALRAEVAELAPLRDVERLKADVAELMPLRQLRAEVAELTPLRNSLLGIVELAPFRLRDMRAQLEQLLAVEAQSRLEALERHAAECRRTTAAFTTELETATRHWAEDQKVALNAAAAAASDAARGAACVDALRSAEARMAQNLGEAVTAAEEGAVRAAARAGCQEIERSRRELEARLDKTELALVEARTAIDARVGRLEQEVADGLDTLRVGKELRDVALKLVAEVETEQRSRGEEQGRRFREFEQESAAVQRAHEHSVERLSGTVARAFDTTGRQLADLQAAIGAAASSKDLDDLSESLKRGQEHFRSELYSRLDAQCVRNRAELREFSVCESQRMRNIEEHVEGALAHSDVRSGVFVDELREETAAQATTQRRLHGNCEAAMRLASEAGKATSKLSDELRAFMDEQRLFCGFLDTEQKSYQDLMTHELSSLTRLVSSGLRTDGRSSAWLESGGSGGAEGSTPRSMEGFDA